MPRVGFAYAIQGMATSSLSLSLSHSLFLSLLLLFLIRGECQQNKWSCAVKWNFYHISSGWVGVEVVVEVVVVGGCMMMMMPPHIPHTPPNTSPPPPFITGHIEGVKFSGGAVINGRAPYGGDQRCHIVCGSALLPASTVNWTTRSEAILKSN